MSNSLKDETMSGIVLCFFLCPQKKKLEVLEVAAKSSIQSEYEEQQHEFCTYDATVTYRTIYKGRKGLKTHKWKTPLGVRTYMMSHVF